MPIPKYRTPIVRPPPPHRLEDLQEVQLVQSASEAGFGEDFLGKMREVEQQERYSKLFFARYFEVSKANMAVAIGVDRLARLDNIWSIIRSKAFGKKSYIATLAQHMVELHDFEVGVHNIELEERLLEIEPRNETNDEKQARKAKAAKYIAAKEEHLLRLYAVRSKAVKDAERDLEILEEKRASRADIAGAKRTLQHQQSQNEQ
ncbi:Nn.00g007660.m01.CDS01 [Neocucurbitaria sp. VM-36]